MVVYAFYLLTVLLNEQLEFNFLLLMDISPNPLSVTKSLVARKKAKKSLKNSIQVIALAEFDVVTGNVPFTIFGYD